MLSWIIARRHPLTTYRAELKESGDTATLAALAELWSRILDEVARLPADAWEILVCYISVETGDVLVYPATAAEPNNRAELPDLFLKVADWVEGASANEGLEDEAYERAYARLLERIVKQLRAAIDDPSVADRFKALGNRPGFAVFAVDAVEDVHMANLTFLWGNRPAPGIPSGTARSMFEFLLKKAQIAPSTAMKLDGERVVQVTFFGGEFNDVYVDLLEQVPDVAGVCKDLRELVLKYTRIEPPAVERLRRLLPHVRIEVLIFGKDA